MLFMLFINLSCILLKNIQTFKNLAVFKLKQILKSSVSEHSFLIYLETKRKTRIL